MQRPHYLDIMEETSPYFYEDFWDLNIAALITPHI
jgi:hypothetical protein